MPTFNAMSSPSLEAAKKRSVCRIQQTLDGPPHIIGCEAEVGKQVRGPPGGPKAVDPDDPALKAHVAPPRERSPRLYGHTQHEGTGQDALAIPLILGGEHLRGRHGYQPHPPTARVQGVHHRCGQTHLRPGGDDDALRWSTTLDQYVPATADIGLLLRRAQLLRERLARQDERRGALMLDGG